MKVVSCISVWLALLLWAETAIATTRLSHKPPPAGAWSTLSFAEDRICDDESALWLSLASFATSGAAYSAPSQQHEWQSRKLAPLQSATSARNSSTSGVITTSVQYLPTPPHKPLWPNVDRWDVLLLLFTASTLFIAAGGGIGGGAVFVVLYVFVGGFTAPQAVALSNITILGGSIANFIANSSRRHPRLDRPLIDWDLILVMEPTTMLGALLGGYLNKLFPVWLTSCLLAALLTLLTWKLLLRAASTFRSESRLLLLQHLQQEKQQQQAAAAVVADALQEPLLLAAAFDSDHDNTHSDAGDACIGYLALNATDDQHEAVQLLSGTNGANGMQLEKQYLIDGDVCHPAAWFVDSYGPADQHSSVLNDAAVAVDPTAAAPAAPAAAADSTMLVLPVPAHLKPLNVTTQQQQAALDQQQQQRQGSAGGHSVSLDPEQQQLLLSPPQAVGLARTPGSQTVPLLLPQYYSSSSSPGGLNCLRFFSCFNTRKLKLTTIRKYERQQLPWQPLLLLSFLSCWVIISDTLKVTIQCGTVSYWLVALSIVPPAAAVTLLVRQWLLTKTAVQTAAAAAVMGDFSPVYEAVTPPPPRRSSNSSGRAAAAGAASGSIHWTPRNSLLYPVLCSAAGVVAGLFGVGGGIVKGPLMLELGVCPEVTAATSATMIMFTAGSAAVVYINFGGVVTDYAVALLLVGFFVTLLGQLCTIKLVKALGRRSIIIFAMSALMLLATVAAGYQSVVAVGTARSEGSGMWNWGSICPQR